MASSEKHILGYLLFITLFIGILTYYHHLKVGLELLGVGVLLGTFYTLLPDIDAPSSKLRSIIAKLSLAIILCCLLGYLYLKNINLIYLSLGVTFFLYLLWFSKHRKIFHSPITGIFLAAPWYFLNPYLFAFTLSGFFIHLVMDGKWFKFFILVSPK